MHRLCWLPFLVCSLVFACNKTTTFTADELQAARHAMPISEVSLMVRSRYDQNKLIAEVQRRHLPAMIDGKTGESLVRLGATPALIAVLKNEANVLTKRQKQAFDELAAKRRATIESEPDAAAQAADERTMASRKTMVVANTDTPEEAYWKADAVYRAKKSDLEARIFSEQGRINRLRGYGYHQSELASAEARLHQYEDELKNLRAPIR